LFRLLQSTSTGKILCLFLVLNSIRCEFCVLRNQLQTQANFSHSIPIHPPMLQLKFQQEYRCV